MGDTLFDHITALHGERPWRTVLDAGTGRHSLGWVRALPSARWTAVTADPSMARALDDLVASKRPDDRLVVGDWSDPALLAGERYDVVLADYLLGAVEGFAPYTQEGLFRRLRPHVAGRLYVVGLEPLPDAPDTDEALVVTEIARARDALLVLGRERTYREFPSAWVRAHLEGAGFRVVSERRFGNVLGHGWIDRQLDMCARRLERLPDASLAAPMGAYLDGLRRRAHGLCDLRRGLRCGADHVFAAEPVA